MTSSYSTLLLFLVQIHSTVIFISQDLVYFNHITSNGSGLGPLLFICTQRRRQSTGTREAMGSCGAHGERVEREPITGLWGKSPQRGPGADAQSPWSGGQGRSPLKLKAFFSSRTCNGQSKCVPFAVFSAIHYNKIKRCKIRAGTPQ